MFKTIRYVWHDLFESADRLCAMRGGNKLRIILDMLWCCVRYTALPGDYFALGFDIMPRGKRAEYVTEHKSNIAFRALNDPGSTILLSNKFYGASVLAPYYGRRFVQSAGLTYDGFLDFIRGEEKFICKPIRGWAGQGHVVYHLDGTRTPEEIYAEIMASDRCILETWIRQHEKLNELYDGAVHTVRLHTIHDGSGKDIRIFGSNLSIAFAGEIAHSHYTTTVSANVDDETGVVLTDGIQSDTDTIYTEVPSTHTRLRGFRLPDWDQAVALVKNAAAAIPELQYIGWDVAFTPDGPVICEGNANPGLHDSQNGAWYLEGHSPGLWSILRHYIDLKKQK